MAYCLTSGITYFFPAEFDEGEALKQLIEAEKQLFRNNFPQELVVLAHAASSIAANYDLVVNEFDGCATPVLKDQPVSLRKDNSFKGCNECIWPKNALNTSGMYTPYMLLTNTLSLDKSPVFLVTKFLKIIIFYTHTRLLAYVESGFVLNFY